MTITEFKAYVKTGQALDTDEIHGFMHEMSEEARRVTFRLNTAYHTADEVRELLSELFGYQVPQSLRVFPPLYADFGILTFLLFYLKNGSIVASNSDFCITPLVLHNTSPRLNSINVGTDCMPY